MTDALTTEKAHGRPRKYSFDDALECMETWVSTMSTDLLIIWNSVQIGCDF